MTPHEKAIKTLSVLIKEGDGNGSDLAERAIDALMSSNSGKAQLQINSLLTLDKEIRSLPVYGSRDSVDFASYVLHYVDRKVRSLREPE
jgi:hypothetical protein